ncbi:MAG: MlaD family protein, partial [Limisphaerales bacterium]
MSKKANPTLVGLFVIVGIVIAVATVLLLGSGKFFTTKTRYVLYFEESVNGLSKGAPVKFKGVTIGAVDDILLHYDKDHDSIHIPVIIHLDTNKILENLATAEVGQTAAYVDLINHLVGRLETDSFVTGRLYIGLRYDRESDAKREHRALQIPEHTEIPTESSQIKALLDQLQGIDIMGLVDTAKSTLANIDGALTNINTKDINDEVVLTIKSARQKIENLDLDGALLSVQQTLTNANSTLMSIEGLANDLNGVGAVAKEKLGPLVAEVTNTTQKAVATLDSIQGVADEL